MTIRLLRGELQSAVDEPEARQQEASKATAPKKRAAKAKTVAASKTTKPTPKKREGTMAAMVLDLLRRKQGATTAEIAKVTEWQNHTIHAFLSATVGKKMGLKVESSKNDAGERTYRITA